MTKSLSTLSNSDMAVFSPEEIRRAGELLGVPLDEASAIKALIIQRDTGLSITRGEISIIPMGGKPTVFINKQGYLAYAAQQPEYDGYEFGIEEKNGDTYAWCKVFRTDRTRPTYEDAWLSEDKQPNSPTWVKMPKRMLAKVAIKRAHQAAFPVLNGLYDPAEAWDNSARIEQRDDDIVIVPTGVSAAAEPVTAEDATDYQVQTKPKPKQAAKSVEIYTLDTAQKVLENYTEKGFDTAIFDRARISSNEFDRTMIDADFKRQVEAARTAKQPETKKAAATIASAKPSFDSRDLGDAALNDTFAAEQPKSPAAKKTVLISENKCEICGGGVQIKEEEMSVNRFGKVYCPTCYKTELAAANAAKQTAPTSESPKYTCSICGAAVTKGRHDTCELFKVPVTCRNCESNNKMGGDAA